jgi:aminopeptidase N
LLSTGTTLSLTFYFKTDSSTSDCNDVVTLSGYYLLRMLNHTLGQETFLRGCGRYVRRHKFGSVDQQDLWEALTLQAHEDGSLDSGFDLGQLMDTWTSRPGFPVVTVTRNYTARSATVTQVCC